ncbi:MAG TPA: NADH-quinone oxidoreductase subunit J [Gemmatimonadales bacterium]|jgi:NADH:ubiquinone oxidoreductase subunit 6 (subunit J)
MNVVGILFGLSLVVAIIGALGSALADSARTAIWSLAASMLGIAGLCLALGNDFVAIVVVIVMAILVPAILLLAVDLAPAPQLDVKEGSALILATGAVAALLALAWLLVRTTWLPAGGARQNTIEWIGSRFLSDHLVALDLLAAMLALSAIGAVALLRGRRAAR